MGAIRYALLGLLIERPGYPYERTDELRAIVEQNRAGTGGDSSLPCRLEEVTSSLNIAAATQQIEAELLWLSDARAEIEQHVAKTQGKK